MTHLVSYTKQVIVFRRRGAVSVQIHVDPREAMGRGDTYDAELLLPATGTAYAAARTPDRRVAGVARGATAAVGCALPELPPDHCVVVHVCALRVTIHHASDSEDDTVHVLPVEIEHREVGMIGR